MNASGRLFMDVSYTRTQSGDLGITRTVRRLFDELQSAAGCVSDTRLYVLDDGHVYFKYWRALNPELVGTVDDVLAGRAIVDCGNFKGRAGLPWERGI